MTVPSEALYQALLSDLSIHHYDEIKHHAVQLQLANLLKKFRGRASEIADKRAILKFLHCNAACERWTFDPNTSVDEELFGTFVSEVHSLLDASWDLYEVLDAGSLGSGSNLGAPFNDRYSKLYGSELATTNEGLYIIYKAWCDEFPLTSDAETNRSKLSGNFTLTKASRLCCVPKYEHVSRVICVEPNLNMFYQRGIGRLIDRRLRRFGYSSEIQPFTNRTLALEGSKYGSWSTIDLESASDSISLNLCKQILPKPLMDAILRTRCASTLIDGVDTPLHMVSSMGNGYTFSLQTALFYCMCRASLRMSNQSPELCSVFGDDIVIVPGKADRLLRRLLALCGFRVNHDKSFSEGPFRESCGRDYYNGQNIRSFYVRTLDDDADFYVAINRANEWSVRIGIPIPNFLRVCKSFLKGPVLFVPLHESDSSGIRIPSEFLPYRVKDQNGSDRYKSLEPRKLKLAYKETSNSWVIIPRHDSYKRKLKRLTVNPDGMMICGITRHLRELSTFIRHNKRRYVRVDKVTPCWSYDHTGDFPTRLLPLRGESLDDPSALSWLKNLVSLTISHSR